MKTKIIAPVAILLALALMSLSASYAFGCEPDDDAPFHCLRQPKSTPTTDPSALQVAAINHPLFGTNPDNAVEPMGVWLFIGPNETHWFKMNDAGLELKVWIDANGQAQNGLALAIFAPEQKDLYGKPIGRGSFNRSEPAHDLIWNGFTIARGVWYAQVFNGSQSPISYRLNYKRIVNSVAGRCSSCHGFNIEWDRCTDKGTNWCENLQQEYQQH